MRFQPGEDEGVDGIAHPVRIARRVRHGGPANRLQRPPIEARALADAAVQTWSLPVGAAVDPAAQGVDLGGIERLLAAASSCCARTRYSRLSADLFGVTSRPTCAALEHGFAPREIEFVFRAGPAVTLQAVGTQERGDVRARTMADVSAAPTGGVTAITARNVTSRRR